MFLSTLILFALYVESNKSFGKIMKKGEDARTIECWNLIN